VQAARQHGVFRTAQVLRLEYGKLKQRVDPAGPDPQHKVPSPAFVEVMAPQAVGLSECLIELEGPRGKMRILVAIEAVDGRKGIDSLARLCQEKLQADPFSGCLFLFRSRRETSIRILVYDGQGFWLAQKRLSKGRFVWWPSRNEQARTLQAHQAQLLLAAGNPEAEAAPAGGRCLRNCVTPGNGNRPIVRRVTWSVAACC
jgi:transposase